MKKPLFLGACLMVLASQPVMAQTAAPDVIVVRVLEHSNSLRFSIARGQQQPEEIEVALKKEQKAASSYYTVLSKLYTQGYVLQGVIPGVSNNAYWAESTLILGKPITKP
ncbi:hypothetical protein FNT36_17280 [Hymenobacter setariae]|uniref:Uncharacterized protein n=1 Tax=Hymenobacter setariae TaxID=2594794 RepID=A0A558BSA1_9BACT|nr:hypothetical protein [Hymenobacter setariae]TVT39406.1 hypothetical protein FNT36_17280 [Hymenobacter setariae]